ncbi:DUF2294 domain-containing protein [Neobacillus sp. LXY-4]|uniref:DUF2294 domain-containing protein n=1 Tax=Neobacillus sp. LXY-4 TaxID=3379826 RepID=UPI003EE3778C
MAEPVYLQEKRIQTGYHHLNEKRLNEGKITNQQRRQLQHEIKIYMEKYAKRLGKGSDFTKVTIWDDMLILRCKGFLTEPEKFIASCAKGGNLIKESRMQIAKQFAIDSVKYFEEKFAANCIHQTFDVESEQDFWIHVMVFDQQLIELK